MSTELYRINKKGDTLLHPDAVKLTIYLKKISKEHLLFIIRAYDYHSPLHQYAKSERILRAKRLTFKTEHYDPSEKDPNFNEAVEEYLSLQYDSNRETIDVLKSKVVDLQNEIKSERDLKRLGTLYDVVANTNKFIKNLQYQVDTTEDAEEIMGKGEISLIERWQLNQLQRKRDAKLEMERTGVIEI